MHCGDPHVDRWTDDFRYGVAQSFRDPKPRAPPRLTPRPSPTRRPPAVWARLPADRQKRLLELLGQLLARLHAANAREEAGHE